MVDFKYTDTLHSRYSVCAAVKAGAQDNYLSDAATKGLDQQIVDEAGSGNPGCHGSRPSPIDEPSDSNAHPRNAGYAEN
jgi:hypothetical protein